jgi:hypothetical protein
MWPGYDAYDLRITLPNKQVWAIDVKDRANPALLGKNTRAFRPDPRFHEAFLVVPQYRFDEREDYARVFNRYRPAGLAGRVELLSDQQLIKKMKAALRTIRQPKLTGAASGRGMADA